MHKPMDYDSSYSANFIPTGLPGGFFVYDAEGDLEILFADQNVIDLFGCHTVAEFREHCNNSFAGMVHPEDYARIQNDINAQTFASDKRHDYVRYRIITKQGEVRYVEDFGHLLHGSDGKQYFYVYIVDVDRDEYYNHNRNSLAESQVLSSMQGTDRLTGLLSMRTFYERVDEDVFQADGRCAPVSFAHFDILHFKVFNEEYGFQAGDDLLCALARTLHEVFPDDPVARFSNDNFVVCAPIDTGEMVSRISHVHNIMIGAHSDTRIEVKVGIYALDQGCDRVTVACDHARLACNTVKRRYDQVYGVYDANLYESLRLQQYVIDNVDEAIRQRNLKVFYQPIVRVSTGKICGYEALARWDDPKMGFLPPSRFIGTLEEYRMIDKVDCFVIDKAFQDLGRLIAEGEPVVPVSVNLSRLDFELCDVFGITEERRKHYGVPVGLIDIEITESTLNDNSLYLIDSIQQFRDAGYRVWVDDFGSGYSALNSLLDYEFEVLKLDLEFLRTYDEHPRAGVLIRNVIQMARGMDVEPLQEGVGREEHLEFLREVGCEMAQGYYFARPMPLEESRAYTRGKGLEWE
ncbi:MAG: GGDEF and EAL domain-containing protein [Coriobacteriales bacterium]|nr:GGDEF and EAL domain-containing protein [Coriobacteriales bacterium]